MLTDDFVEVIKSGKFSLRQACLFGRSVLHWADSEYNLPKTKIRFCHIVCPINACVYGEIKHNCFIIVVNLYPFVMSTSRPALKYYRLLLSILHEINHIRLYQNNKHAKIKEYRELLATWECWLGKDKYRKIHFADAFLKKNHRRKMYTSSSEELFCVYKSYKQANDIFSCIFTDDEKKLFGNIEETATLLAENTEIAYTKTGLPINQFVFLVGQIQRKIISSNRNNCPASAVLFYPNGSIKNIDALFSGRNADNAALYDQLLLRVFLSLDMNYDEIFKNNANLKQHMAQLINQYIDHAIVNIQKWNEGNIFVCDEMLQDNIAMLISDVKRLNMLLQKYGMEKSSGTVFPLFR